MIGGSKNSAFFGTNDEREREREEGSHIKAFSRTLFRKKLSYFLIKKIEFCGNNLRDSANFIFCKGQNRDGKFSKTFIREILWP